MSFQISDMTTAAVVTSAIDNKVGANFSANSSNQQAAALNTQQPALSQAIKAPEKTDTNNANEKNQEQDPKDQVLDSLNEEFVSNMTKELNELMQKINCDLEFHYNKEVDIMSVKMVNKTTKEVIREYPPEDMVKGLIRAQEWLGAFLDKNA